MGRWSQRRRNGGGTQPLVYMVIAQITDGDEITVTWSAPVDASAMTADSFSAEPDGTQADTVTQASPEVTILEFPAAINTNTDLLFSGPQPPLQSNQSIPLS